MITETDIANLPEPEIIEELDVEEIVAEYRADFIARYPAFDTQLLESDTSSKIFEVCAFRETLLRARANDVARNDLIAFSTGATLDHLAAFYDVTRLTDETDDRLRSRVILAIQGQSSGGTVPRYKFYAMSADVRIRDVAIWVDASSPLIHVSVLSTVNGGVPYPEMLTAVQTALTNAEVQMVNDQFVIEGAVSQTADIVADIYLLPNTNAALFDTLEQSLRDAWASVGGLGRDLTRSWVNAQLMRAGVQRVVISAPATDTVAAFNRAIALGTVTLTNKGRDY